MFEKLGPNAATRRYRLNAVLGVAVGAAVTTLIALNADKAVNAMDGIFTGNPESGDTPAPTYEECPDFYAPSTTVLGELGTPQEVCIEPLPMQEQP